VKLQERHRCCKLKLEEVKAGGGESLAHTRRRSSYPIIHAPGFVPIVANAHSVFATSYELNTSDLTLGIPFPRSKRRLQILRLQILEPL
jgi:hypothetical protein